VTTKLTYEIIWNLNYLSLQSLLMKSYGILIICDYKAYL